MATPDQIVARARAVLPALHASLGLRLVSGEYCVGSAIVNCTPGVKRDRAVIKVHVLHARGNVKITLLEGWGGFDLNRCCKRIKALIAKLDALPAPARVNVYTGKPTTKEDRGP